jgi:hypothetical protein
VSRLNHLVLTLALDKLRYEPFHIDVLVSAACFYEGAKAALQEIACRTCVELIRIEDYLEVDSRRSA